MIVHSGEPLDLADYWREAFEERAAEIDRLNAQALELCAEISGLRRERQEWRSRMGLKVTDDVVRENERLRGLLREVRARFPAGFHDAELMDRICAALSGAADQPPAVTAMDEQCRTIQRAWETWDAYIKRTTNTTDGVKCRHLVDDGKRCVNCGLLVITDAAP